MHIQRTSTVILVIGLSTLAAPARAQDVAAAKVLFSQGLAEMEAEHYDKGCPAIEESYRLDPRPGTLFTLAECESKRGQLATAVARYDDYLSLYSRLTPEQQRTQGQREKRARDQRAVLGPQVPMLTLTLPPDAPKETVVKRDGTVLAAPALGLTLPIDPGEHVVTTQAPGGEVTELRVTLGNGEKKQITLQVKTGSGASAPVSPPPFNPVVVAPSPSVQVMTQGPTPRQESRVEAQRGTSRRRVGMYVAGGAGVAGVILGSVMGGLTLGKKSVVYQNCGVPGDPTGCNDKGLAAALDAKTTGLVSTVGFVVGGAGVATAVVLLLTEPTHAPAASRGVQAGLLSAGREGAIFGFWGGW